MDDMGAIHFAAQKGHLDVLRALLSSGASVKAITRKGMTPLHFAAQGSHLELVKYLVKKGASLSAKTKAGKTPLDLASNEEVRLFLAEQERQTKNGESSNKEKAEECETKASTLGPEDNPDAESLPPAVDEEDNDREKRKGDEDDVREASPQPKKARIKLSHLQSSDDTQEEDEQ